MGNFAIKAIGAALAAISLGAISPAFAQNVAPTDLSAWSVGTFGTGTGDVSVDNGALKINVTAIDDQPWHVRAEAHGLKISDGTTYTVSFKAKSDSAHPIDLAAQIEADDWHMIGLQQSFSLSPSWHEYRTTFQASKVGANTVQFLIDAGAKTGPVWISDLAVTPGAPDTLMQPTNDPTNWRFDVSGGAAGTFVADGDALKVAISQMGQQPWSAQLYQEGIVPKDGVTYTLTFAAKADAPRDLPTNVQETKNWTTVGLQTNFRLSTDWQTFTASFTAANPQGIVCRAPAFILGTATGTIWIKNLTYTAGH